MADENQRKGNPALGQRARAARVALGMTQVQIAERCGLPQGVVSRYERGEIEEPGATKMITLARALGVTVEWLTLGEGEGPAVTAAE